MKCHSCSHPEREAIDRALVAGEPPRRVLAARYGIAKSSLGDHARNHLSAALRGAIARTTREDGLLGSFEDLVKDVRRLQRKAEAARDFPTALQAIRELTRLLELAVAHQPKRPEAPVRVRLEFTPRGAKTIIGDEAPAIETTSAEKAQQAPHEEPVAEAPPTVNTPAPVAPEPYDKDSRQAREDRARRAEEAADAAEDRDNSDARRGVSKGKWGVF